MVKLRKLDFEISIRIFHILITVRFLYRFYTENLQRNMEIKSTDVPNKNFAIQDKIKYKRKSIKYFQYSCDGITIMYRKLRIKITFTNNTPY